MEGVREARLLQWLRKRDGEGVDSGKGRRLEKTGKSFKNIGGGTVKICHQEK